MRKKLRKSDNFIQHDSRRLQHCTQFDTHTTHGTLRSNKLHLLFSFECPAPIAPPRKGITTTVRRASGR
jgi:hypothetical protein